VTDSRETDGRTHRQTRR